MSIPLACIHYQGYGGGVSQGVQFRVKFGTATAEECGESCPDYIPNPESAPIIGYCNSHIEKYVKELLDEGFTDTDQIIALLKERFTKEILG